jgi:IS1 family transposase
METIKKRYIIATDKGLKPTDSVASTYPKSELARRLKEFKQGWPDDNWVVYEVFCKDYLLYFDKMDEAKANIARLFNERNASRGRFFFEETKGEGTNTH